MACPRLTALHLDGLCVAGSPALSQLLSRLLRLRELRLAKSQLGNAGLEALFS